MHKVAWINLVFLMNQYYIIIENNLSVESLISTLTDIKGQLKNMTVDYKALKEDLQGMKRELNLHNREFDDMCEHYLQYIIYLYLLDF